MKSFTRGVLLGIGVGLLVAPMKGEEMRHVLAERMTEWRNALPADSPVTQYAGRVCASLTSVKENWRGYVRRVVEQAKDTGAALGKKAMRSVGRPDEQSSRTREVSRAGR